MSVGFELIWIEHDLFRSMIIRRRKRDQLLLRRLELKREQPSWPRHDAAMRRSVFCIERGDGLLNPSTVRTRIQPRTRVVVLRTGPCLYRWRPGLLKSAVIVHDFYAAIIIGDGLLLSLRSRSVHPVAGDHKGRGNGEGIHHYASVSHNLIVIQNCWSCPLTPLPARTLTGLH